MNTHYHRRADSHIKTQDSIVSLCIVLTVDRIVVQIKITIYIAIAKMAASATAILRFIMSKTIAVVAEIAVIGLAVATAKFETLECITTTRFVILRRCEWSASHEGLSRRTLLRGSLTVSC